MTRVLVTGGAGLLGRTMVPRLAQAGYTVRVMSRRLRREGELPEAEWAQADLETGAGLREAVAEVDTIVHAASKPTPTAAKKVDVEGTARLLEAGRAAGASHLLYISIVGIERFPSFPYYRAKLKAEEEIRAGGYPTGDTVSPVSGCAAASGYAFAGGTPAH